jgi:hypothetical protein
MSVLRGDVIEDEVEVAESYKKMLRLKIPEDAVRHKMEGKRRS